MEQAEAFCIHQELSREGVERGWRWWTGQSLVNGCSRCFSFAGSSARRPRGIHPASLLGPLLAGSSPHLQIWAASATAQKRSSLQSGEPPLPDSTRQLPYAFPLLSEDMKSGSWRQRKWEVLGESGAQIYDHIQG